MLNYLQIAYLSLNIIHSSIGYLVYKHEKIVPATILRIVKYGAFRYDGNHAKFTTRLDLPKYYYRHFYMFACFLNTTSLLYMVLVYFYGFQVNVYYVKFLEAFNGRTSPVSVLAAITALILLTLQCIKRCYETHRMQVFANYSKIYPSTYIIGFLYYLAVNVAIVGQAPMFCGEKNREAITWTDLRTMVALVPGIPIFLWAWHEQYQTNVILANLRKDKKSGRVVTEDHKIPHGRLFDGISSPHRYCEIILYAVLFAIMQTKTLFCLILWVLCNQIQSSVIVHKWYKETFTNYPSERYALFKGIL